MKLINQAEQILMGVVYITLGLSILISLMFIIGFIASSISTSNPSPYFIIPFIIVTIGISAVIGYKESKE